MRLLWIVCLALPLSAFGQTVPSLEWQVFPLEGASEFHGLLTTSDGLLSWGDIGPDASLQAVALLSPLTEGGPAWRWTDAQGGRSRFFSGAPAGQGFLLAGEATRGGAPTRPLLVRLDADGDTLWTREPDWGGTVSLHGLAACAAGGWIATGERDAQALLARLDSLGDTLWTRSFEFFPGYEDVFYDVAELSDGRLVACGQTYHDWIEWTSRYAVLAWFSSAGELLDIYNPYDAQMLALDVMEDGRVVVTGDYQFAYLPVWICQDSQAIVYRQFGTMDRNLMGYDVRACPEGGLALAGRWQTAAGEMANLLMRLDADGQEQWRAAYDICGIDIAQGLARLGDGSYRLVGSCLPSRTAYLLATTSEWGVSVPPSRAPASHSITIRPTGAGVRIEWAGNAGAPQALRICNLLGQTIRDLNLSPSSAGQLLIPLTGLPAGNYLMQVVSAAGQETRVVSWLP